RVRHRPHHRLPSGQHGAVTAQVQLLDLVLAPHRDVARVAVGRRQHLAGVRPDDRVAQERSGAGVQVRDVAGLAAGGARVGGVEVLAVASGPHRVGAGAGEGVRHVAGDPLVDGGVPDADLVVAALADAEDVYVGAGQQL